jgi:hypothetical protein
MSEAVVQKPVVFITGAAGGTGLVTAVLFLKNGWTAPALDKVASHFYCWCGRFLCQVMPVDTLARGYHA